MPSSRQRQDYLNYMVKINGKDHTNRLRRSDIRLGMGVSSVDATPRPLSKGRRALQSVKDVWNRLVGRQDSSKDV